MILIMFKRLFSTILFLLSILVASAWTKSDTTYHKTPTRDFDLLHTDLKLQPIWQLNRMKGEANLTLVTYFYPQRTLVLDAVSFQINKISSSIKGKQVPITYTYDSLKLSINFPYFITAKDTVVVSIDYVAIPDSAEKIIGKSIKENKGLYFINTDGKRKRVPMQMWTQGETNSNSHWFPTIDLPSEKHTQKIQVTYDQKLVSLSNGKLISTKLNADQTKTDIWIQKLPHSVYLTVLVLGDFKIVKDQWKHISVDYYMEPQYESMARPIFGRTPEMIEFFSKKLNVPFPWDKFSQVIVHDFVAGAMENTTAVTFNKFVQKDSRELIDNNDDETIAHELFHHWFGDLATCESWAHLTLNESFANYSEYLWNEYKYGLDEAQEYWNKDLQSYISQSNRKKEPLIRMNYRNPDDMFDVISYAKGGKILHMLRNYIGDEAFFKSISVYLKRFSFKTAEYSDLRKTIEEVTGEDMNWYFNQWYLKGGHPILTSLYKKAENGCWVFLSQKHNYDTSFIYKLPLDILVYTQEKSEKIRLILNHKSDSFFIPTHNPVLAVSIDPNHTLVGEKKETKSTEDWIYLLKNDANYLTQYQALKKLKLYRFNALVKEALYQSLYSKKDLVIYRTLETLEKDWIQDKKFHEKIAEIALKNKKGIVRAKALEILNEDSIRTLYSSLAKKSIKDSSYLVEAEALKILQKTDSLEALNYALTCKLPNSYNVLNALFNIIASTNDIKYLYKFEEGLENIQGYERIAIFINYGKFVAKMPDDIYKKGLKTMQDEYAKDEETSKYAGGSGFNYLLGVLSQNKSEPYISRHKEANEIYKKLIEKDPNNGTQDTE